MSERSSLPFVSAPAWTTSLLIVAIAAFWPGYFSVLNTVGAVIHFHSITATSWMLLLIGQSYSIHQGWRRWHRRCGMLSMALFPLFLSSSLVVISEGNAAPSPFNQGVGGRLALFDLLSVAGFAWFYYQALSRRRRIALHAGFMLATALFLIYPAAFRLLPRLVPMLSISGPEDFENVAVSVYISSVLTVAFSIWVAVRLGRDGAPFWQAAALIVFMALGLATFTHGAWWLELVTSFGRLPNSSVALFGALLGGGLAFAGWRKGMAPCSAQRSGAAR